MGSGECVYYSDPDFNTVYTAQDGSNERLPYQNMNKKGFRLPTEAEWEWAAQGGKRAKWAGTNEKARLKDYAWYVDGNGGDAGGKTHPVKQKLPNGYGLYDMSGNVYEWCWNWNDGKTPASGETDPVGPKRLYVEAVGTLLTQPLLVPIGAATNLPITFSITMSVFDWCAGKHSL